MKKKKTLMEFIRYGIGGVSTTVLNLATYHIMVWLGVDYRISNLTALLMSKTFGYIINKLFVFRSHCRDRKELFTEIGSYALTRGLTGVIDYFGLMFLVEIVLMNKIIAKYVIQVIVILLNYVFGKFLVFRKKTSEKMDLH